MTVQEDRHGAGAVPSVGEKRSLGAGERTSKSGGESCRADKRERLADPVE
jgi:hypothetical protein